mmetsp:Transcript_30975/g.100089  ORF Transcript_30975/g.100089 Transcript_30975/m.100089 type:complete len:315 (-) Transcript_30975:538-1482(-)
MEVCRPTHVWQGGAVTHKQGHPPTHRRPHAPHAARLAQRPTQTVPPSINHLESLHRDTNRTMPAGVQAAHTLEEQPDLIPLLPRHPTRAHACAASRVDSDRPQQVGARRTGNLVPFKRLERVLHIGAHAARRVLAWTCADSLRLSGPTGGLLTRNAIGPSRQSVEPNTAAAVPRWSATSPAPRHLLPRATPTNGRSLGAQPHAFVPEAVRRPCARAPAASEHGSRRAADGGQLPGLEGGALRAAGFGWCVLAREWLGESGQARLDCRGRAVGEEGGGWEVFGGAEADTGIVDPTVRGAERALRAARLLAGDQPE